MIRILADRHTKDISSYVDRHVQQFQTSIELRKSKELHDRLVIIDQETCWIIGGSIKDAANKKPTYLIPLNIQIAAAKIKIYEEIWGSANSADKKQ